MLHFAGRIAFGVNVGKLFQLQRAFQSDRKIDAAAEIKKIGARKNSFARSSIASDFVEQMLHLHRQFSQLLRVRLGFASGVSVPRSWPRYKPNR